MFQVPIGQFVLEKLSIKRWILLELFVACEVTECEAVAGFLLATRRLPILEVPQFFGCPGKIQIFHYHQDVRESCPAAQVGCGLTSPG